MLLNEPPLKDVAVLGRHRILWHAAGDCADKPSLVIGGPRLHDAPVTPHALGKTDERRHNIGEGRVGGRGQGAALFDRYVLRALAGGGRMRALARRGGAGCLNRCSAPVCSQVKDGAAEVSLAQNMMARCAARADECGAAARYALRMLISAARAVAAGLDSELSPKRGGPSVTPAVSCCCRSEALFARDSKRHTPGCWCSQRPIAGRALPRRPDPACQFACYSAHQRLQNEGLRAILRTARMHAQWQTEQHNIFVPGSPNRRKMRARLCLLAVCATVSFALIGQLGVTVSRSVPSAASPHLFRPLGQRHRSWGRDHACVAAIGASIQNPAKAHFRGL